MLPYGLRIIIVIIGVTSSLSLAKDAEPQLRDKQPPCNHDEVRRFYMRNSNQR